MKKFLLKSYLTISKYIKSNLGLIKFPIILIIIGFSYYQINKFDISYKVLNTYLKFELIQKHSILIGLLFVCIVLNWSFEALKWQMLLLNIQKISFINSIKSVIIGLIIGNITPMMIGDYGARAISINKKHRTESIFVNIMGSFLQTLVVLLFGTIGIYFLKNSNLNLPYFESLFYPLSFISFLGLLFVFMDSNQLQKLLNEVPITKIIIPEFTFIVKLELLGISVLRYLSFAIQYILFFYIFDTHLTFSYLLIGISILYLLKTVGGGLNMIGDLSIRVAFSMLYFAKLGISPELSGLITMLIWILNILLPIVIGLTYLSTQKIKL